MDGGTSRGLIGPDPVVIVDTGYSLGIGKTGAFRGENPCISAIEVQRNHLKRDYLS